MIVHGIQLEDFLELSVEQAAMTMLPELVDTGGPAGFGAMTLNTVLRNFDSRLPDASVPDEMPHRYYRQVAEAWQWLRNQGFLAPHPEQDGWEGATRLAQAELQRGGFLERVRGLSVLRHAVLDAELERAVLDDFRRAEYRDAVLAAMREVEIRVKTLGNGRRSGQLPDDLVGVKLMQNAFGPGGPLEDKTLVAGERESRRELFVGAIGYYGSPTHHRAVEYTDPQEVAEIVLLANNLLRIAEDAAAAPMVL